VVARVARAAAAIGANVPEAALTDLDYVESRLDDPKALGMLTWPHATAEHVVRAYRVIAKGLRARANQELGRLDAEAQAIQARRTILDETLHDAYGPEIAQQAMLAEAQLAMNANQRHDMAGTGAWLVRALARADDLRARAHGVSDREQLDVLWLAAELTTSMHAPLVPDLAKRIAAASTELATRRDPALRAYARWFEVYGALVP
jgi:hypothetical protein